MKRTFIDSCVLIAASRLDNTNSISQNAMNILVDPERSFISSLYVKLETLPHAIRNKRELEVEFYETFFEAVQEWVDCNEELLECAHEQIIQNNGLSGIDAIHVAAAVLSNADELITAEKPTKPICNVTSVKVITIHPEYTP